MHEIARINGDTITHNVHEPQNFNILREIDDNTNKRNTNGLTQKPRETLQPRKGPAISLSDTGLTDSGLFTAIQNQEISKKLHLSTLSSDKLELHPFEPVKSLHISVKPFQIEVDQENLRNTYFELVQHEVKHLREKFELNNRNYQMDDLIRLTDTSKKILNYGVTEKYTDCDENGKSIFYNQECRRVDIERKVGLCLFLKVYKRMINIINDEFDSTLKHSLEHKSAKAFNIAGDNDDIIKNKWQQIVRILDDKQEYLPDIWELAMSEYMFYHM